MAGEHRKDSPGIELYQVLQQAISPQASVSLSLPGAGLVERYNGAQIHWSLPGAREIFEGTVSRERRRQGKIWSKEISKEIGHRCVPGLFLAKALWYVQQDKINHVTELGQFWRTQFLPTQLW